MNKTIRKTLMALLLPAAALTARAQLTIDSCYAMARANYPLIARYGLIEKTRQYNLENAAKGYLPQVALTAQASWQSDVTDIPIDTRRLGLAGVALPEMKRDQYRLAVDVNQTLWDGGNIRSEQAVERTRAEAESRSLDVELYALNGRVNQLFFGLLLTDGRLSQNRLLQQELTRHCREVENLMAGGVANRSDLDALRVDLLKARQDEAARLARLAEVAGKYSEAERKAGAAERAWKEAAAAAEAAGKNAAEAAEKKDRARKTAYALGEVFMRGQAAYLAAGLEEGRPCPVCGALHHPAAARSEEAVPDKKDVDFARKAAEQAEKDAETERLRAEALRKEESRLLAVKKAEDASLALLAGELPEAFRDGAALAKRQAALAGQIADHEKRRQKAAADAAKAAGDEQAAKKEEELTAKEVDALRVQYREDHAALLARARAEGFPDIAAVEPYFKRITKEKELREALAGYQASVKAEADKAAAERAVISGAEKPDMAAWNRARDEKTSLMKETLTAKTRAEEEFARLREAKRRAAELFAAEKEVDRQHQLAGRLAILFRGDANGVNLERFVLGALLDDVLLKANLRLKAMSGGRYQLTRRQERDDRRKKSGLDMDVFDSYTGQARPANTLSGGETFLASLSLALGLADVVQEYAGGIRLDAMFIDEGFGTLDSESLDLALRTLTALHGQSRLVGIISHVAELDERIPAKLRIRKTDCGSTAAFEISE